MKRAIVLCLIFVLLLGAQAPAVAPAYYAAWTWRGVGSLSAGKAQTLTPANFHDVRDGVVTLSGDTFTPQYVGLINVSGTCSLQAKANNFKASLLIGVVPYPLIDTADVTESFSVAVPAAPMRLAVVQTNATNVVRCVLLFEAAE